MESSERKRQPQQSAGNRRKGRRRLFWIFALAAVPLYVALWLSSTFRFHHHVGGGTDGVLPPNAKQNFVQNHRQKKTKIKEPLSRTGLVKDAAPRVANVTENASAQTSLQVKTSMAKAARATGSAHNLSDKAGDSTKKEDLYIHYQLHHGDRPYNLTFGPWTRCHVGVTYNKRGKKPIERVPLSPEFAAILNLTTYFQTNLKILSVGDSVGMQFHEVLEEAAGGVWQDNLSGRRVVYHNAWGEHESVSVTAPLRSSIDRNGNIDDNLGTRDGALAAFRMTGLLLPEGKNKPPPNTGPSKSGAGGWLPAHIQQLTTHPYWNETTSSTSKSIRSFDAMLFRIPHGWLPLNVVTKEKLTEALLLAHELFGIHTVIIHTLFLNNNVKTLEDLQQMHQANKMIRDLVNNWEHSEKIPHILLLDFGGWIDQLVELNAKQLGMIDSTVIPTTSVANYTLDRLGCLKFPPSVAAACATLENRTECACIRNMMSIDGMHWCMESLGGRITAATACLLQCSLHPKPQQRDCEQGCNEEFMSLKPVSELLVRIP